MVSRAIGTLSAYRIMWMLVMFDLPVMTAEERHAATRFRLALLDEGFEMCQYSVYVRCCASTTEARTYTRHVEGELPEGGRVDILYFTDKQYENIVSFKGHRPGQRPKNPDQYVLL